MSKHAPSLNALRAFVSICKHGTLKAAAGELFVTPSALSHQIKNLEDTLGTPLFHRSRAGLSLTESGKLIEGDLKHAFSLIQQSMIKIQTHEPANILNISMLSTFAMRWFIPRLSSFQKKHPDIEVRISTSVHDVNFQQEGIDCAIRSGDGQWQGLHTAYLLSEAFTPVCNPDLAKALMSPSDIIKHTLLHACLRPDDWQVWLNAMGITAPSKQEQTFETRNFAIQAAIDGVGIAMIDPSLVAEDIKTGRLIVPFKQTLADKNAYYFVYPKNHINHKSIQALQGWLLQQVNTSTKKYPQVTLGV